jgi:uncharacterized membrane protein YozB (DUF420 family)
VVFVLLFVVVAAGVVAVGYLLPTARRDADWFGAASAVVVAVFSATGCMVAGWVVLTRRAMKAGIEDFFSLLLSGATIWLFGFLLHSASSAR